ncbi:hypothetical protein JX266_013176 [Neoarthrinium moseri]|nr:hypothetical protein JX266_013176 [Neoarthrinium moseri]
MPSPLRPEAPKAAEPRYGQSFDPWNSSSTGHQRAENRLGGSTGWRDSRNAKLQSQFRSGRSGGKRMSDTVGAGSEFWDPKAKALIPPELRARARSSVMDMLAKPGTMQKSLASSRGSTLASTEGQDGLPTDERHMAYEDEARQAAAPLPRKILEGVVVYVNGSTHPAISDHKLKQVLAEHGAGMSTHLGRRQVTHVILGKPAGGRGGAGGGLAGGKLQKEIQKLGGCAVKFVGVEWVLESIKAGKRLPETKFAPLKIALKGQQSIFGLATKAKAPVESKSPDDEPPPSGQRL